MAKVKKKNPVGAPSRYKKEYCEMVIRHMEQGYSFDSFAGAIKVCRATVYGWTKKHKQFLDAKNTGRERELLWWERVYNRAAVGNNIIKEKQANGTTVERELKPNAALIIFAMKNKFRTMWNEYQDDKDTRDSISITYGSRSD